MLAKPIIETVEDAGYRLTETRRALAGLIADQPGHFTAADLVEDANASHLGVSRATIFRSIDLFVELGVIERIDLPNGDHAYVECARSHHHHVVCSSCGRSTDVAELGLDAVAREVEERTGYRVDTHRLELFGICPDCVRAAPAPSL